MFNSNLVSSPYNYNQEVSNRVEGKQDTVEQEIFPTSNILQIWVIGNSHARIAKKEKKKECGMA